MKAIPYGQYGGPDVLQVQDVPKPVPDDDEVLIRNYRTTVNRTDCAYRSAYPKINRLIAGLLKPKRSILGNELAGEVERVGKNVTLFKVGERVFGLSPNKLGAYAEYITLGKSKAIVTMPTGITYRTAAAFCDSAMLAHIALKKACIGPGHSVLINGASGSIGIASVLLAKHAGATVTGVCSTR